MKSLLFVMAVTVCSLAHAIGHGRPAPSHPEIVEMYFGGEICTGTLIGPHVVLSAGHCSGKFHFVHEKKEYDVEMIPHQSAVDWQRLESSFIKTDQYPDNFLDISLGIIDKAIEGPYSTVITSPIKTKKTFLYGYGARRDGGFGGSGFGRLMRAKNKIFAFEKLHYSMKSHIFYNRGKVLPGDSGGPTYNSVGIQIGVHSASNDKFSFDARLDTEEAQLFLNEFAQQHNVGICGISLECLKP